MNAATPRILVTAAQLIDDRDNVERRWAGRADITWLRPPAGAQQVDPEVLRDQVSSVRAFVVGDDVVDRSIVGAADDLELVVKWGVGVDAIDADALHSRGIELRNTPGLFGDEVADLALAYLLMLTRHLLPVHEGVAAGGWPKPLVRSFSSLTVGIVGCGAVGRELVKRVTSLGAKALVVDVDERALASAEAAGGDRADWSGAVAGCDALVLCRPAVPGAPPVLDRSALGAMRQGAYVVNVARGSLVDEPALAEALREGWLGGAALDTYEVEPLPAYARLRSAPNVVFGAHNGSYTRDAIERTNRAVLDLVEKELEL